MKERAYEGVAISPMSVTAALSALALLVLIGWQSVDRFASVAPGVAATTLQGQVGDGAQPQDALASLASSTALLATSSDPVSAASSGALADILGAYAGLAQQGNYDSAAGTVIGNSIGASLNAPVPYAAFTDADIKTDAATSAARMLKYRSDLQVALQPLMKNKASELELFARYIATKDQSYLTQLGTAASNYFAAASSTAQVVVPGDAASVQLGMLNAMEQFGATLESLIAHASDPLASTMLLNNYNIAEQNMLASFNALAQYEKSKQP